MAFSPSDFSKIWASTSPLTPYSFTEANYKQGWNFVGATPPARQMWDSYMKLSDEKSQYLANNTFRLDDGNVTTIPNGADLDDYTTAGTYKTTSSTVTASLSNCPTTGTAIKLVVLYVGYGTMAYGQQIIFTQNKSIYVRNATNVGDWGTWKRVAFAEDVMKIAGSYIPTSVVKGTAPSTETYPFWSAIYESAGTESKNRLGALGFIVQTDGAYIFRILTNEPVADSTASISVSLYNDGTNKRFYALPDNTVDLGSSSFRWKQLYAGTATINTSDERLKSNITPISDDVLDAWGEVGWYQYQFNDSIAEKGEKARLHTGAIAQRIESVFTAHGLDANRYGLLCYDEWDATPAERDENGEIVNPAQPAGNRYSLRYEEALCMEAAYQRRRADRLEERIESLERAINNEHTTR